MKRIRFTVTLTGELNEKVDQLATKKNFSKNTLINEACWQYVEEFEAKHGKIEIEKKHYGNT